MNLVDALRQSIEDCYFFTMFVNQMTALFAELANHT